MGSGADAWVQILLLPLPAGVNLKTVTRRLRTKGIMIIVPTAWVARLSGLIYTVTELRFKHMESMLWKLQMIIMMMTILLMYNEPFASSGTTQV